MSLVIDIPSLSQFHLIEAGILCWEHHDSLGIIYPLTATTVLLFCLKSLRNLKSYQTFQFVDESRSFSYELGIQLTVHLTSLSLSPPQKAVWVETNTFLFVYYYEPYVINLFLILYVFLMVDNSWPLAHPYCKQCSRLPVRNINWHAGNDAFSDDRPNLGRCFQIGRWTVLQNMTHNGALWYLTLERNNQIARWNIRYHFNDLVYFQRFFDCIYWCMPDTKIFTIVLMKFYYTRGNLIALYWF